MWFAKNSNDKKELISRVLMLALLFVVLVFAASYLISLNFSLGWYAKNENVAASGMNASVQRSKAEATYTAYLYDSKSNELVVNDSESAAPSFVSLLGDEGYLKLSPFDQIFKSRNKYTPVIVKIHLSEIDAGLHNSGTLTINLSRSEISGLNNANSLGNYVTSVMRFSAVTGRYHENTVLSGITNKNLVAPALNPELRDIYGAVYGYTTGTPAPSETFMSFTGTGPYTYTEQSDISLTLNYTAADVVNGEMDVYLYISYDETLVGHKTTTIISGDVSVIGQTDDIENNLSQMTVSFGS